MRRFTQNKIIMLKPEKIRISRNTPRSNFDENEIRTLSKSISALGMVEPISVRKNGDAYEIISGERRLRAAVAAGLRRVPCVQYLVDEKTAAFFALTNNLQHKPLSFFEEARSISNLIIRYRLTLTEAALRLGVSENELSKKLRLLRLDESLQKKIVAACLTSEHARLLLSVDELSREELLGVVIKEGLNVKQTEEMINGLNKPREENYEPVHTDPEPQIKNLMGDTRILLNSLEKCVAVIEDSMMDVSFKKNESEKYIEYKFRINKQESEIKPCKQLKIC